MKRFSPFPRSPESAVGRKKLEAPRALLLVYPNTYYLGMSNLGFHTVLSLVDSLPEWYAERTFLGYERSLEKNRTFSSFDVIAFSIPYELDYRNLPYFLKKAGIPLRSSERDDRHPMIIAGGAAPTINPEPIADFTDIVVIGEAEGVLENILTRLGEGSANSRLTKLESLRGREGVYIPRFYRPRFDGTGRLTALAPDDGAPFPVRGNRAADLEDFRATSRYLTEDTVFPHRGLIEVGRGCPWKCRFCLMGYICRPVRNRSPRAIYSLARSLRPRTGQLGLISPSVSDHPAIDSIAPTLVKKGFSLSVSSLRIESVSEALLEALAAGGQREITLAPEAATSRLRKSLNKDIPEETMVSLLKNVARSGFRWAKLYFMVGLPGEGEEDIGAIVDLSRRLSSLLPLKIRISPFVPKPHTPFQWVPLDSYESLKSKLGYLRSSLRRIKRVEVKTGSAREAVWQAYFNYGDRRTAEVIARGNFPGTPRSDLPFRRRGRDDFFPWSVTAGEVARERLWDEYQEWAAG